MFTSLLIVISPIVAAAPSLESGTQLTYRGAMIAEKGDPANTRKSIELVVFVSSSADSSATVYWSLKEDGRGAWPWTGRFGQWTLDSSGQGNDEMAPALLYERDAGTSVVPLIAPLLSTKQPLTRDKKWKVGKYEYHVADSKKIGDRNTWKVVVSSAYGHKRTIWVDQSSALMVALKETVFIGQGEQHELKLELAEAKRLRPSERSSLSNSFDQLLSLREELKVDQRTRTVQWKPEQVMLLKKQFPKIAEIAANGPLSDLITDARRDTTDQKDRNITIAAIRKQVLGKDMTEFSLKTLTGKSVDRKSLNGRVTVFHFWQYRDRPLEEPYGQVGYLDFLTRGNDSKDLSVYGVTVDQRLSEPRERGKVVAAARKLKSFMNLSYPVLLDDGAVIKLIGDPRVAGAKLPLYVVIGRDGKVVHYHPGLYDIDRDRGLRELDEVVQQALAK